MVRLYFSEIPTPWVEGVLRRPGRLDSVESNGRRLFKGYGELRTDEERIAYLGLIVELQRAGRELSALASTPKNSTGYVRGRRD